ncbi:MAG: SpoIIE family protein phosphatase [Myxococcota bacterium]|nr:SpoIIE family protein phosphatase [Myxococcota bacterium]
MTREQPTTTGAPPGLAGKAEEFSGPFALLADMTRRFADSLELTPALVTALESIVSQVGAEAGSLWLVEPAAREIVCEASVGPSEIAGLRLSLDQGIVGRCVRENACQSVLDVSKDPAFAKSVDEGSGMVTRSLLCAPMSGADGAIGAIELVNRMEGDGCFTVSDLNVLEVLASSASLALANARMATAAAEHKRVQRELELAAEIQRALLPAVDSPGFPIHALNVPARTVSGDFFDFLELPGGRIAFCLGDVSGKGMNAALLMAKTASLFRCLSKTIDSPGRLLAVINDELADTASRGMFVTMAAGIYEPETGGLVLANAGHEPPLYHPREGGFEPIEALEPPLGIATGLLPPEGYPESRIELNGGNLFVFSDGLTEAFGQDGEQLGAAGLERIFEEFSEASIHDCVEGVMSRVSSLEHRDDLTLLGIEDSRASATRSSDSVELLLVHRFEAIAKELSGMRKALAEALAAAGADESIRTDIVMAVDEACQNVIRHAYSGKPPGDVELTLEQRNAEVTVWLRDFAPPVDPACLDQGRDLADVRPGGLGTRFMKELMDDVSFAEPPEGGGNLLRLVKRLS